MCPPSAVCCVKPVCLSADTHTHVCVCVRVFSAGRVSSRSRGRRAPATASEAPLNLIRPVGRSLAHSATGLSHRKGRGGGSGVRGRGGWSILHHGGRDKAVCPPHQFHRYNWGGGVSLATKPSQEWRRVGWGGGGGQEKRGRKGGRRLCGGIHDVTSA